MFRRSNQFLWGLALVSLTCVAYIPAMQGGFVWDDDNYVTQNQTLRSLSGLKSIWTDPSATPQYYPLVHSMFWIEYQTWGLWPTGYHVVNILLHAANSVLLWQILRKLDFPAAWFAAALFALHPVHVESVAWITERKNVLSGLFYLASALVYFRFAFSSESEARTPARWGTYSLSLILFAAALLSKTVTVTLPAALLLIVAWRRSRLTTRDIWPLVPMFLIGIPFGLFTVWLERHHVGAIGADWQFSFVDRCLIAGRAIWFYAFKLIWPGELMFIYPRWRIDSALWWQYVFPAAVIAVVAILGRRGKLTGPMAAVCFFAGTLFPALGFFDIFPMRYSFVADHFQYLASIGLILLLATAGQKLTQQLPPDNPHVARGVGAIVLLHLMGMTWQQAGIYSDSETLWRDTLSKNPECTMAHTNLGLILGQQGRLDEASLEFRAALRIDDRDSYALLNLANVRCEQGRFDEAIEHFQRILQAEPRNVSARYNMANALEALQRTRDAETQFLKVLEIDPKHPQARLNLAVLLMQSQRWDEAQGQLEELVRLEPEYYLPHYNLAYVYRHQGNERLARFHASEVIRLVPDSPYSREMSQQILR